MPPTGAPAGAGHLNPNARWPFWVEQVRGQPISSPSGNQYTQTFTAALSFTGAVRT